MARPGMSLIGIITTFLLKARFEMDDTGNRLGK